MVSLLNVLISSISYDANEMKVYEEDSDVSIQGEGLKYRSYEGIVFSSDPAIDIAKLLPPAYIPIPSIWATSSLPLALLPLEILIRHVQDVSKQLAALASQVSIIEEEVVNVQRVPFDQTDFKDLIGRLHLCNANTVKLHRRWHFQHTLAATIYELIESLRPEDLNLPRKAKSKKKAKRITSEKKYQSLLRTVAAQQKLIQSIKYDLEVLPQRISNQFTTVCHGTCSHEYFARSHARHRSTTSSPNETRRQASRSRTNRPKSPNRPARTANTWSRSPRRHYETALRSKPSLC